MNYRPLAHHIKCILCKSKYYHRFIRSTTTSSLTCTVTIVLNILLLTTLCCSDVVIQRSLIYQPWDLYLLETVGVVRSSALFNHGEAVQNWAVLHQLYLGHFLEWIDILYNDISRDIKIADWTIDASHYHTIVQPLIMSQWRNEKRCFGR